MRFRNASLNRQLEAIPTSLDDSIRAKLHNIIFEERLSPERFDLFENICSSSTEVLSSHFQYYRRYIRSPIHFPETFLSGNNLAALGSIEETQKIVRVEWVDNPLETLGYTNGDFAKIMECISDSSTKHSSSILRRFLREWNGLRDNRPHFAAFRDELIEEIEADNWPILLRNRLGLAHMQPRGGKDVRVFLMEYSVSEVLQSCARISDIVYPFTIPTVLDSGPWEYFFPAPLSLLCGRTLNLSPIYDDKDLVAEILHAPIPYRRRHIQKVGVISTPIPGHGIRSLRNAHLWAVRVAAACDDFGSEI